MKMRNWIFTVGMTGCVLCSAILNAAEKEQQNKATGELIVIINSARNDQGHIELHLMNSTDQFNNKSPSYSVCHTAINNLKAQCSFQSLPYGDYAIFAFHDQNSDQTLNYNFLGSPTEKLAISAVDLADNNQPTYLQSRFEFSSPKAQLFLNLQ
ncbi:DUF2141 domain-containing protein [Vibrio genomosp. F10]|uniref:DUF2141 domain-containing protein n=3 Tax=Vibrio genomosp. F10 TaxID=723171 RepID=A0A1B9R398_9VIBR|nr:DUF2141 domain-containing protein [Vibrio genomosp. F10]OCH78729.1 hypothetical protein A6E14_16775 [Vibrio genomosp. F10]OEE36004.1 hypothetical protein A1QO_19500 [Vibrio genomosp. F10 str. ZF-129]OEE93790.1 hypothetical protein A1QM_01400 [Vibrio genomosp. F10 str. 9ZC157]OEF04372.1 hypothetical protein A1QK_10025 [Vibrio genomosp. F10 str. 9ZD137]OEF09596.1 hypothetical protein A1QI_14185 [Vibrio genomosp. F10 str. 9ZB36]